MSAPFMRAGRSLFCGVALALASGLAGCVHVPSVDLGTELPAGWRHSVTHPPADLSGWWDAFGDPKLADLVRRVVVGNLDVAQATERLRAERALYARREAPHQPSLQIRTDDTIDADAGRSYFVGGFDATWELGLFGRAEGFDRIAEGKLNEAAANVHEARISVVAEVVREWIQLRAAQRRGELLAATLATQRRQAALQATRLRLHLSQPAELARARAAVADTLAEQSDAAADADAAAERLALLLGSNDPAPEWFAPAPLPALTSFGPIAPPVDLLRSRPEIALAEARVLQAAGDLGMARADLYPRVGLGAALLWATNVGHPSNTNQIGTLGPTIDIPLFDWGMRKAREDAKGHLLEAAVIAYRASVLAGISEVETALARLQQLATREEARKRAVREWGAAVHAMNVRRHIGLASDLDATATELDRAHAELELVAARAEHDIAYVALFKALGGAAIPAPTERAAAAPDRMQG